MHRELLKIYTELADGEQKKFDGPSYREGIWSVFEDMENNPDTYLTLIDALMVMKEIKDGE